jgi:hypothetical protein
MSSIDQTLTQAYELIEADQLDEARALLQPLLASEGDNADVWWVYAHAVTDVNEARSALGSVLRLDPAYPGAMELVQSLESRFPAPAAGIKRLVPAPGAPPSLPDMPEATGEPDFFDEWDTEEGETEEAGAPRSRARRLLIPIAALIALLVVLVAVLVIVKPFGTTARTPTPTEVAQAAVTETPAAQEAASNTPEAATLAPTIVPSETSAAEVTTPTEQAAVATEQATATIEATQTPEVAITESGGAPSFDALRNALSDFDIPQDGIAVSSTTLGNTLLVTVCVSDTSALRTTLPGAMDAVAKQSPSAGGQIDAVGVRVVNCSENTILRVVAVKTQDALAYANGSLSSRDFQRAWQAAG